MIEQILQADRYLQVDQVEKARDVYQKVVDMDPGNAIAVVGLARCALADGDDQLSLSLSPLKNNQASYINFDLSVSLSVYRFTSSKRASTNHFLLKLHQSSY